jgi:quinol monooxygenase YgiN
MGTDRGRRTSLNDLPRAPPYTVRISPSESAMTDTDIPLVFYVTLRVKPEQIDAWLEAVHALIDRMAEEPAFVSCDLHRDANDPTVFTLYERWNEESVEDFLAHQSTDYRAAYDALLPDLLQAPREPQVLELLQSWA